MIFHRYLEVWNETSRYDNDSDNVLLNKQINVRISEEKCDKIQVFKMAIIYE